MNSSKDSFLVEAVEVRKTYYLGKRTLDVLRGVSLDVQPGEFVALRGASGAGKSTLLHLLGGLDVPTAGQVRFRGQSLESWSDGKLARWRNAEIGFIFQSYYLLPELDALENVSAPARLARMPTREAEGRARDLLARVGLADRVDHKPYELSGGEQQRVALARALINSPQIVLADEPTGNLDSNTGKEMIDLLCALQQERKVTMIIATHDAVLAARAPRVIELADGRIL